MRKSSLIDNLLNRRGMALATVLLVMLVLMLLASGVVIIGTSNLKQSKTTVDHSQAYYVAEAGVNYLVKDLDDEIKVLIGQKMSAEQILTGIISWASKYGKSPIVQLNIDFKKESELVGGQTFVSAATLLVDPTGKDANDNTILTISSTGTIGTISRTLSKQITLNETIFDNAILTYGKLNINKLEVVKDGTVRALTSKSNTINIETGNNKSNLRSVIVSTRDTDKILAGCSVWNGMECKKGKDPSITFEYEPPFELPKVVPPTPPVVDKVLDILKNDSNIQGFVDSKGVVDISSNNLKNKTYNVFDINGSKTDFYAKEFNVLSTVQGFSIDVGNRDVQIYTDKLDIKGSFNIINKAGIGSLTIFVKANTFTFSCSQNEICGAFGPAKKDAVDKLPETLLGIASKFRVIVIGDSSDKSSFSRDFKGITYMNIISDLNLDITGNAMFNGLFITSGNVINLNGTVKSSAIIYAPNADIIFGGTSGHTGAVIGNTFENKQSGSTSFEYYIPPSFSPPFNFLNPYTSNSYSATVEN